MKEKSQTAKEKSSERNYRGNEIKKNVTTGCDAAVLTGDDFASGESKRHGC
jgi:hypothetical protein